MKYKFKDIVKEKEGFLRGPFGGDLKKSIFVPYSKDCYKVYEQGVVLQQDETIGRYYISKEYFDKKMSKFEVLPNDFLVSCSGVNYGAIYELPQNIEQGVINQALLRVRLNNSLVDSKYFYYYFKSYIVKKIIGGSGDSTIPNFPPMDVVKNIEIDIPDIKTQKIIGNILHKIDKKIKLNNKINQELEKLAKTLYNYWFVQFDFPDENNRPYKSSGGKMVYNNILKKDIPCDWFVDNVKSRIEHINTGLNPRDNFILNNGDIRYITVKNLTTNGSIDFTNCDTIDKQAQKIVHKRSDISKGDILFASIAPLGRCYLIQETPLDWDINESVFAIRPNCDTLQEYLYMFFMSETFVKKAENSSTGSVFAGIRIKTLEEMPLLIPNEKVLISFKKYIFKILLKKHQKDIENQELTRLRDWLLPMLMNGQITINP